MDSKVGTYRWQSLSFTVPASVVDETVVTFLEDVEEPGYSLTLAEDVLPPGGSLAAYVEGASAEIREAAAAVEELSQQKRKVAGQEAVEVVRLITVEDEGTSRQAEVFIRTHTGVAVIAATAIPERFDDAKRALEALLSSIKIT